MKKTTLTLVLMMLFLKAFSQTLCESTVVMPYQTIVQCDTNAWKLAFQDDFNGNRLDLAKWELQAWGQGALYGKNGPSQEYNTLDNIEVSDGVLKIIAKEETVQRRAIAWKPDDAILDDGLPNLRTYHYTSSNIWTKSQFLYGKFEARIKIPKGKGFWPAFWIFGGNPWNEIDIFEFWNENDLLGRFDPSKLSRVHHMTTHYDYDNDGKTNMCSTKYKGVDFSQDFHVFGLVWEKDRIEWYVDGELKRTDYKYYTTANQPADCTIEAGKQYVMNKIYPVDPMAIVLNLAIQHGDDERGNSKAPDRSTTFPSQMEIDWVRYYTKETGQEVAMADLSQISATHTSNETVAGKEVGTDGSQTVKPKQHKVKVDATGGNATPKDETVVTTNKPMAKVIRKSIEFDMGCCYRFMDDNTKNGPGLGASVLFALSLDKLKASAGVEFAKKDCYSLPLTQSPADSLPTIEHKLKYLNFPLLVRARCFQNKGLALGVSGGLLLNKVVGYDKVSHLEGERSYRESNVDFSSSLGLTLRLGLNLSKELRYHWRLNVDPFVDCKVRMNKVVQGPDLPIVPENRFSLGFKVGLEYLF